MLDAARFHLAMLPRAAALGVVVLSAATGCRGLTDPGETLLTSQPSWEWQSACCGFAADDRTPASEGYRFVLRFTTQGVVQAVRNDTVLVETRYRVITSAGGPTSDPAVTVTYDHPIPIGPGIVPAPSHVIVQLAGGGLLLRNPQCADCYGDWTFLPRLEQ